MTRALLQTDKGDINIELFSKEAPGTVANFVKLIEAGFYDGLAFHRVIENFMVQGGGMLPDNVYQVIAVPQDRVMWIHGQNYSGWEEVNLKPLFDNG